MKKCIQIKEVLLDIIIFMEIDTRKVLNALVTIAMRFDRSEVNRFYDEKSKNANNPVVQSRINYILSCYEEDLYMEYQAQQYEENMSE